MKNRTIDTTYFWKHTAERAIKTAAQVALTTLGAEAVNVFSVDWLEIAGMSAGGAVISVLMSLASIPVGEDRGNPSAI